MSLIRKVMLVALSVVTLVMTNGCTTQTGRHLDDDRVASIERGKTTRAEVEELFGKPIHTAMLEGGRRMLLYSYSKTTGFQVLYFGSAETQSQVLQVLVDANGIVEDYELSSGENSFVTH
jgi:outer membrane protein assembly factor BamE (lipoprotein component of BamABCDE complex)